MTLTTIQPGWYKSHEPVANYGRITIFRMAPGRWQVWNQEMCPVHEAKTYTECRNVMLACEGK
jgi:hypothetical protein